MGLLPNVSTLTDRLFYQPTGQMFVSALFGVALALTFQKVCKDRKCIMIQAPDIKQMTSKVYDFQGECYRYKTQSVKCPTDNTPIIS
jgi:hypothetical protein